MLENLGCMQVQAKAQAMATALQTIGKFTIRKRSGDKESIFGRYGRTHILTSLHPCLAVHYVFDILFLAQHCLHNALGLSTRCVCVV